MIEMTLREKQKQEALERMRMLNIMGKVRNDFRTSDKIYYSERQNSMFNAVLYWLDNNPQFVEIVNEFEKKHNAMVYHAQLTHFEFGDCLSLLYVSSNEEDWQYDREDLKQNCAFVRVENLHNKGFSEFGTIVIKPSMGGIARVG